MHKETTFAETFESLRLSRGWTPAEVARRLEVYPTEVSRWRHGRGGISIRNVRKVADLFGVDRAELEQLAGYGDSSVVDSGVTTDPEIEALLDAERADMKDELRGIPEAFRTVILNAQRSARRVAVDSVKAAIELAQGQPISEPQSQPISSASNRRRADRRKGTDAPTSGLTGTYGFGQPQQHFANTPALATA